MLVFKPWFVTTGLLVGHTTQADVDVGSGPFQIVVQGDNTNECGGGTATQTIEMSVQDNNKAPVWTDHVEYDAIYCLGEHYDLRVGNMVSDYEGDKLTFRYVECNVGYGEESFSAGLEFLANAGKTNERGGHGMYLIQAARPAAP